MTHGKQRAADEPASLWCHPRPATLSCTDGQNIHLWPHEERITACASYHGGQLAIDAADRPHRLASQIKARVYVAGAVQDPGFDDAQKQRLEDALTAAQVDQSSRPATRGTAGYLRTLPCMICPAEKHWRKRFAVLDQTLKS
jgi:carboxymethylenebutenolidase